jgi:hypothetical protein
MDKLEWIDRYLDRALSHDEAVGLEQSLQTDADLQHLLDGVTVARDAVRASALRAQVRNLHVQFIDEVRQQDEEGIEQETETAIVRPLRYGYGQSLRWGARVAASGLLILAGYGSYQYKNATIDAYYSAKFVEYQLPTTRGADDQRSTIDELYREGNFAAITQRFTKLSNQAPRDQFLTGMAHLHQHQYGQAISRFLRVQQANKQQEQPLFGQETDYYLALAYLGDGRIGDAYPLFEKIKNTPRHLYHQNVTDSDLWQLSLLRWKSN